MEYIFNRKFIFKKAKSISSAIVKEIIKTDSDICANSKETIVLVTEITKIPMEKNQMSTDVESQSHIETILAPLLGIETDFFVRPLGNSPLPLTARNIAQIKKTFPVPREHNIIWADAEFDLRPSGIVLTDRGLFIRTDVGIFGKKSNEKKSVFDDLSEEDAQDQVQHYDQFHSGKSVLLYYRWDSFDFNWFIDESELKNKALLVAPQCSKRFVDACRAYSSQSSKYKIKEERIAGQYKDDVEKQFMADAAVGATAGAALESAQTAVFVEHKAYVNNPAGHGEMAEEANNRLDILRGFDAVVIGRDNTKDGADRQIGNIFIQTKYFKTARGSLEACFNPETGQYRYMHEGYPMQLEVPKDQYQTVLEGFKWKITEGKVPGVSNPDEAANIVRKGHLTYDQAVNLTKPGTIESLSFDVLSGAVICSSAFGITFVVTVFLTWRKTNDIKQAIQAGTSVGIQIFGISFVQHMLVSQFARTNLANSLLRPSQYIVGKLGYQTSATVINSVRALSGKRAIHGAAASKHLAKVLRSNVLIATLSVAVFSIPETYNLAVSKISGAQYVKNISVLAGSVAGGTCGMIGAGLAAAKIAGLAGTTVAPGIGTMVGISGGFIGGAIGAKVVKFAGDIIHEDDVETIGRMFNAYVSCLIGEYLFDEHEINRLITRLDKTEEKEFKGLFENIAKFSEQEFVIRDFLSPIFDEIAKERSKFVLPSNEKLIDSMIEIIG